MSDQYSTTAPTAPGQGAANVPPEQKGAVQPQYLTLEEARRMAEEAEEKAFRRAQGLIEKTNAGVVKKVQNNLKNLEQSIALQKKIGVEVTPEQEDKLRTQIFQQAFTEVEESPAPAQSVPAQVAPQPQPDNIDPITAEAVKMMQEADVWINDDDPESDGIDQSSIFAYLESVKKAIEAKRQRIGTPAPARIAGGGVSGQSTSNILPDGIPPIERLNRYFQNKR